MAIAAGASPTSATTRSIGTSWSWRGSRSTCSSIGCRGLVEMRAIRVGSSWDGLLLGPAAWAVSTQLNYALVPWQCAQGIAITPFIAMTLALLSLLGGALSWRARHQGSASLKPKRAPHTGTFVPTLSLLAAVLFALVIVMQGAAALILYGCVR